MMGREIRRVPAGWEHPVDPNPNPRWGPSRWDWTGQGRYFQPLFDEDYETALQQWWDERQQWKAGTHEFQSDGTYEEFAGRSPDPAYYRPAWPEEERACFQVYETVSEGTPVSPVFASREELASWLVDQGYSREAASAFAEDGWAPSAISTPDRFYRDIESAVLRNA
jgi:hypothetical protein